MVYPWFICNSNLKVKIVPCSISILCPSFGFSQIALHFYKKALAFKEYCGSITINKIAKL